MFAVAVGSGLLAYATLALGLLGLLYPWLFLALAGAAGVGVGGEVGSILLGLATARRPLRQACWAMLTIQPMPNRSTHMPNSSPHTCFSSGTVTVPPSLSFSQ